MEISLDDSSLNILQQIFDSSDLDKDGKVSRADLKFSLSLKSDEEADHLFTSLKSLSGNSKSDEFLTFEEYCKGIMNFPEILEAYQEGPEPQTEVFEQRKELKIDFLPDRLKDCINFYNKSLKAKIPYSDSENSEDLISALRYCLEKLKAKHDSEIINGSIELLYLVRDLYRSHEETLLDFKANIQECRAKLESCEMRNEKLATQNDLLLSQVDRLENSQQQTVKISLDISQENQNLMSRLKEAEKKADNTSSYIKHIESIILNKEKDLAKMEKEIRQLNSLKAIQTMKIPGFQISSSKYASKRGSILNLENKRQSIPTKELKFNMISTQLSKKNKEFLQKEAEVDDLYEEIKSLENEKESLKEDLRKMTEKFKILQCEIDNKQSVDCEPFYLPSLQDEILKTNENPFYDDYFSPTIIEKPASPKKPVFKDFSTQTIGAIKKSAKDKSRAYCSWFS